MTRAESLARLAAEHPRSILPDYGAWCDGVGANPHHPEAWSAEHKIAYRAAKLATFKETCRFLLRLAHADVAYRTGSRRDFLKTHREAAEDAFRGAPVRSPWRYCPCHPGTGNPSIDDIGLPYWPTGEPPDAAEERGKAWVGADPFERTPMKPAVAVALATIESFNPKRSTP